MTMVLGRPFFRNDASPRGFPRVSRPTLKMPCARYSTSLDSGRTLFDSLSPFNFDVASTSSSSSRVAGLVMLSTPSPSATANGNKVDREFEKFRKISEEWLRNREIEESENKVLGLGSRSPSPQRIIPSSRYYRRSSSAQPSETSSRSSRSPSPPRKSSERSYRSPSTNRSESPYRSFRSRSPSPIVFSPITKTFVRSHSYDNDSNYSFRSGSPSSRESSVPPSAYRRSSSYDGEKRFYTLPSRSPSPQRHTALSSIFRRSNSCENAERIRNNFRARSTSPQRLTPASSYYRKNGGYDDVDNGYHSSSYNSRSSSLQNNPYFLNLFNRNNNNFNNASYENALSNRNNYNNLKKFYSGTNGYKFNSLPRNIFSTKANSPKRDSLSNLFNRNPLTNSYLNDHQKRNGYCVIHNNYSNNRFNNLHNNNSVSSSSKPPLVSSNRTSEKQFLPNTIPDLPNYRMTSPRRFSEEPSPFRRPLATLHEDEVVARRRFSDDIRKRSLDTSGVMNDYNDHQRKLSEAGVRKLSDASLVLTEDTDSFIIGDRVWVGGTKKGSISYIGETQFAPGEWAGVTLDEPIGKNNGSVGGVRYFQCEPKKGVFSRLTRLSQVPLSERDLEVLAAKQAFSPKSTPPPPSSAPLRATRSVTPPSESYRKTSQSSESARKITPSSPGKSGSQSPVSSIKKGPTPLPTIISDLKIGERVIIDSTSGTKYGVLRYLGRTEFAEGVWAGVELDDASGKNDGSVAGKKYFVCRSKYGLFAPVSRVRSFAHRSSTTRSALPTIRRSGSKESLGNSSAASTASSLKGTRRPSRTSASSTSPSTKALQNDEDGDWFY